jgi:hypothetical protein
MEFWWGKKTERDHLEDPGIDGRISINLRKVQQGRTGLIWLRKGTRRGLLKLDSQEEHCSMSVKQTSLEGPGRISHCTAKQ